METTPHLARRTISSPLNKPNQQTIHRRKSLVLIGLLSAVALSVSHGTAELAQTISGGKGSVKTQTNRRTLIPRKSSTRNRGSNESSSSPTVYRAPIRFNKVVPSGAELWIAGAIFQPSSLDYEGLLAREQRGTIVSKRVSEPREITDFTFASRSEAWAIDRGKLYRSSDTGRNWERVPIAGNPRLNRVTFLDPVQGWIIGDDGVIYRTTDGGITWKQQDSGTDLHLENVQFVNPSHGWITGKRRSEVGWPLTWSEVLLGTTNGGETWETLATENELRIYAMHFVNIMDGWAVEFQSQNIVHTTDGGKTWAIQRAGSGTVFETIFFANSQEGWAAGDDILHTTDGGRTWNPQLRRMRPEGGRIEGIGFIDGRRGLAIKDMEILSTKDGGRRWKTIFRIEPSKSETALVLP